MSEKSKKAKTTKRIVTIPEGVEVRREGNEIIVKGKKGELKRIFSHPMVGLSIKGNEIIVSSESARRKAIAVVGTWEAHLKNMFLGVQNGYEAKLKAIHMHFPIKMSMEGNIFKVSNFLGEKKPRTVKMPDGINVKIDKNDVTITGLDKEVVGRAAALIEQVTVVKRFDRRIFQDGCYVTQKVRPIQGN